MVGLPVFGKEGSGTPVFKILVRALRLFRGCRYFCVELVKLLPVHRYSVDSFSLPGPSGTLGSGQKRMILPRHHTPLVLAESKIPLKPVLGA